MAQTFQGLDLFLNYLDRIASKEAMKNALEDLGIAAANASKRYISAGKVKPESRAAQLRNGKTLLDTGRGRNSIEHRVDVNDESVSIGTNVKYMKEQRERFKREFLVTPDEKVIEKIIAYWLEGRK